MIDDDELGLAGHVRTGLGRVYSRGCAFETLPGVGASRSARTVATSPSMSRPARSATLSAPPAPRCWTARASSSKSFTATPTPARRSCKYDLVFDVRADDSVISPTDAKATWHQILEKPSTPTI
jgi:hypothetical protein